MPVAATRKRKQTEDMAEPSPPKRVTRARAAKTSEEPVKSTKTTTKTTKITTASARAATKAKTAAAKPTRTTTKKVAVEPVEKDTQDEVEAEAEEAPKVPRGRGRPRKDAAPAVQAPAPKTTRTRQTKAATSSTTSKLTRPTKAKVTEEEETIEDEVDQDEKPVTARKATRGRPATTAKTTVTATKKPATKTAPKKKVAFEKDGQDDKENAPAPVEKKKAVVKPTGMRAQPVRKPVAARATRAKKSASEPSIQSKATESQPLSPKKPTQVAKSSGSDSEDELCSASPVKALSKSPVKPPMSIHRSPVKPMTHTEATGSQGSPTPASPIKNLGASVLASPAKRPPQSPLKNILKESPKKLTLPDSPMKPQLEASSQSPFKDSLKVSPRRVQLQPSGLQGPSSPLKQSLLQSPARRPMSPMKSSLFASPTKQNAPAFDASAFKLPTITPKKLELSSFRGDESPQPSIKSHTMTPEQETALRAREVSPSPVKSTSDALLYDNFDVSATPQTGTEEPTPPGISLFPSYRSPVEGSDSEDELATGALDIISPSRKFNIARKDFALDTPTFSGKGIVHDLGSSEKPVQPLSMTPLALQLSTWCASSPEKKSSDVESVDTQGISTPKGPTLLAAPTTVEKGNVSVHPSPAKESQFEEQMFVHEQEPLSILEDDLQAQPENEMQLPMDFDNMDLDVDMIDTFEAPEIHPINDSQSSEQYGDENAAPVDPLLVFAPISAGYQGTPEADEVNVHTPEQAPRVRNTEIHTVSKVPLRAADDGHSPIKVSRKRAKSTSAPLADISDIRPMLPRNNTVISYSMGEAIEEETMDQTTPGRKVSFETQTIQQLMTPVKGGAPAQASPFKSNRKGADSRILRGAVIYVDVHTSEGADASGIFLEVLTSMGAKCVKQWSWHPRTSSADPANTPNAKVGITHVVYKDGGKRALEKVREAKGLVLCVGVGWVLDCERENKWLDEAPYAVDTSTIPRGGHNRRKSMEPTRFSNTNGNLVPADEVSTPARITVESPTNEFLSFSADSRRSSIRPLPSPGQDEIEEEEEEEDLQPVPGTPSPSDFNFEDLDGQTNWGSPTTPYFLGKGSELMQMTCPPKQTMQSLFPVSGRIEDHPDEVVRRRLIEARRKSLQWAPKIGSPLGRFNPR